ncbi:DNA polymerase epsilon subunit 3 [Armadillidium vulgare]|nr:DNA polymerase epsilon subunit 3 [Armadillidium vulgare]
MVERPEDLNLPNAVVTRIIKDSLPEGIAVSKEARSAIAKAASVFVLYTTSTALLVTQKNKKKTLTAQDVLLALKEIEFEKFVEPLEESLESYKKSQQNKKEQKAAKDKAKKADEEKSSSKAQEEPMEVQTTDGDKENQDD